MNNYNQTSELSYKSAIVQAFNPNLGEISCQTGPELYPKCIPPIKKGIRLQTENYKDVFEYDWQNSIVFKKAIAAE